MLGAAARCLPEHWAARYGVRPVLLETFVDPTRFDATSYRAANWIRVGATSGRRDGIAKDLWLYPLAARWRERLCAAAPRRLGTVARPEAPAHWAEEEFGTLRLHDERLKQRLFTIARDFYNRSQASIPEACGSNSRTKGAYRFFQNPQVTMDVILTPHTEATVAGPAGYDYVQLPPPSGHHRPGTDQHQE